MLQAVLFNKDSWTTKSARQWLKDHSHIPIKRVYITDTQLRYRIAEPDDTKKYITQKITPDISYVIMG